MTSFDTPLPTVSLDAAGLVALADLTVSQQRCALTGSSSIFDIFVICPGIHLQQKATELNKGEYPACAALTTGYVFRIENQAMVYYLQKVGRTGHLTTLSVMGEREYYKKVARRAVGLDWRWLASSLTYLAAVFSTIAAILILSYSNDWWGLAIILLLMFCRLCNFLVVRNRSKLGWFGQPEPGVKGDLIILLSQDRWIRMKGLVDDLKAVTSGLWLQDPTHVQAGFTSLATVLVYMSAALASNAEQSGKIVLLVLLLLDASLLAIANILTDQLTMHDRIIKIDGDRKKYARRLDLAEELIKETGRDDWAVSLGMINRKDSQSKVSTDGGVTM